MKGRRLILEYTNPPADSKKLIERSQRNVVRIAPEDELDFNIMSHEQRLMLRRCSDSKQGQVALVGRLSSTNYFPVHIIIL